MSVYQVNDRRSVGHKTPGHLNTLSTTEVHVKRCGEMSRGKKH